MRITLKRSVWIWSKGVNKIHVSLYHSIWSLYWNITQQELRIGEYLPKISGKTKTVCDRGNLSYKHRFFATLPPLPIFYPIPTRKTMLSISVLIVVSLLIPCKFNVRTVATATDNFFILKNEEGELTYLRWMIKFCLFISKSSWTNWLTICLEKAILCKIKKK